MDRAELDHDLGRLTAFATPMPLPLGTSDTWAQRCWVVRFTSPFPEGRDAEEIAGELERVAVAAVREALVVQGLPVDGNEAVVSVKLRPFEEQYALVVITTIRPQQDHASAYLIAASWVLTTLDRMMRLADIQGIPRRYWDLIVRP